MSPIAQQLNASRSSLPTVSAPTDDQPPSIVNRHSIASLWQAVEKLL
ncbi:hypothetical protein X946_4751 [Burkholderia sp. ABCPW 111]|nr:hypothetical protein X946_4751 [Burkholderia sp. ABCPW 111]